MYRFCHTLTWIRHECTCVPHPETPSHLLPHPITLGHPSAPAPSTLYHAWNLDWQLFSHMIIYMFQCHSPKSPYPRPLWVQKTVLYICLFCCFRCRVIVTIFLNYICIYICISILYWQIWPWNTEWSREKTNRVLPRKWTGHTNTLFQQHKETLNMGITRWSTPKFDYILCSQRWRSCLYSQQKQDQELTVAHNMNSLLQNSNLNWRV